MRAAPRCFCIALSSRAIGRAAERAARAAVADTLQRIRVLMWCGASAVAGGGAGGGAAAAASSARALASMYGTMDGWLLDCCGLHLLLVVVLVVLFLLLA